MTPHRYFKQQGFSLIEAIIAMAVGLVTSMMFVAIITEGFQRVRAVKRIERLHANAVYLTDAFSYRIKQASFLAVSALPNEEMTLYFPDSSTTSIALVGGEILIGGTSFTDDGIAVTDFTLSKMARSVRIGFTLKAQGGDETLSSTTTIAQRNSL